MANWLGNNGIDINTYQSLGDAYSQMYGGTEQVEEEVEVVVDAYMVSPENAEAIAEGKKKCKEGYKLEDGKCVKKEKKTVVVVRGGYGGHGHHHHGDEDNENDSDSNDGNGDVSEQFEAWMTEVKEQYDCSQFDDNDLYSIFMDKDARDLLFQ